MKNFSIWQRAVSAPLQYKYDEIFQMLLPFESCRKNRDDCPVVNFMLNLNISKLKLYLLLNFKFDLIYNKALIHNVLVLHHLYGIRKLNVYRLSLNVYINAWIGPILISAIHSPSKHCRKKHDYVEFFKTLGIFSWW